MNIIGIKLNFSLSNYNWNAILARLVCQSIRKTSGNVMSGQSRFDVERASDTGKASF